MKKVEATIKPFKLEEVKEALAAVGVSGLTVAEVRGFGRQHGHVEVYRGAEYTVEFQPKLRLEIVRSDDKAEAVAAAILKSAASGHVGDGKIFITPVGSVVRIRTGETGDAALE